MKIYHGLHDRNSVDSLGNHFFGGTAQLTTNIFTLSAAIKSETSQ